MDKNSNVFKAKEMRTGPDNVFDTLDEYSKKIKDFGARYERDSFQIMDRF